jgi:hypothetical protein
MKQIIKIIIFLLLFVSLIFYIVVNHSAVESKHSCVGKITKSGEVISSNEPLFFLMNKYRWWVHLWGEDDGDIRIELPLKQTQFYTFKSLGELYQLNSHKEFKGMYSTLSNTLSLNLSEGVYDGKCSIIQN